VLLTRVLNSLPLFQLALARAVLAAAAFPPLFKRKVRVRQNELLRPSVVLSLVALLLAVSPRPCSSDVSLPLGALSSLACMHPACQPPLSRPNTVFGYFARPLLAPRSDFLSLAKSGWRERAAARAEKRRGGGVCLACTHTVSVRWRGPSGARGGRLVSGEGLGRAAPIPWPWHSEPCPGPAGRSTARCCKARRVGSGFQFELYRWTVHGRLAM